MCGAIQYSCQADSQALQQCSVLTDMHAETSIANIDVTSLQSTTSVFTSSSHTVPDTINQCMVKLLQGITFHALHLNLSAATCVLRREPTARLADPQKAVSWPPWVFAVRTQNPDAAHLAAQGSDRQSSTLGSAIGAEYCPRTSDVFAELNCTILGGEDLCVDLCSHIRTNGIWH